jgi:hypothetical protein
VIPIKKSDPQIPLHFSIAMGVRHGDGELKNAVDRVLAENAAPIDSLLRRYGVPLVAAEPRVARNSTGGRP